MALTPPKRTNKRGAGRPRLGDCRIETVVPQAVMDELIRREKRGLGYRTRIAAQVLTKGLLGHVNSFNR
jgi:hypothetical protein